MKGRAVNRYGRLAQQHWAKWRPRELSQIPDPEAYFSRLGLEVETQVEQVATDLAGDDPAGEGYLDKLGRLRMARFTAESQVLRELVLLPPEPGHPEAEENPQTPEAPWLPMVMTPDHPNYHDLDDDPLLSKAQRDPSESDPPEPSSR
jgi:hypothetical protein